jgi:ornithine decarboxylase
MEYWTSDGLYGSFNCIVYDQQIPSYTVLRNPRMPPPTHNEAKDSMRPSILWGASCDTFDKITQEPVLLPTLRNGDFLQIESFGAYTISAAKDFNGIKMTNIPTFYIGNQGSGASPL